MGHDPMETLVRKEAECDNGQQEGEECGEQRGVADACVERPNLRLRIVRQAVEHRAALVHQRFAVCVDQPGRPAPRRYRACHARIADAHDRQPGLYAPGDRLPGVLERLVGMREPAVVGNEDQRLRTHLGQPPHLRRVGILKAYRDAKLYAGEVQSLQLARRAAADRRELLQRGYPLVAGYVLAERNKVHLVVGLNGIGRIEAVERGGIELLAALEPGAAREHPLCAGLRAYPAGELQRVSGTNAAGFAIGAFRQDDKPGLERRDIGEKVPVYLGGVLVGALEHAREVALDHRDGDGLSIALCLGPAGVDGLCGGIQRPDERERQKRLDAARPVAPRGVEDALGYRGDRSVDEHDDHRQQIYAA